MAFVETRLDGNDVIYQTSGGPLYSTEVAPVLSGFESRQINWATARGRWDLGERTLKRSELDTIIAFFHAMKGRGHGFRFKDWADFQAAIANGILGTGIGTGLPSQQLTKRYSIGGQTTDKTIRKPVAGAVSIFRNAILSVAGAGAGQYALDTTTGIVTWVADSSSTVTAVTVGTTTVVTLTAALSGLIVGGRLFLSGLGGTVGATLNGFAHAITVIAANVYTLSVNTTGLAWTSGGSGFKYPQPADALTWSGDFDYPVRFDADEIRTSMEARDGAESLHFLSSLPLIEIRT